MLINTTFTRDRQGKPLVELDGDLFHGAELSIRQLLDLSHKLRWIADHAESLPTDGKHYRPTKMAVEVCV